MNSIRIFKSEIKTLISFSETFKITSPIVSEVRITVAVQPNDDRIGVECWSTWLSAIVLRTSISIKENL